MSEAVKYTAGVWKQANAPKGLLAWIEKYHGWMRKENRSPEGNIEPSNTELKEERDI